MRSPLKVRQSSPIVLGVAVLAGVAFALGAEEPVGAPASPQPGTPAPAKTVVNTGANTGAVDGSAGAAAATTPRFTVETVRGRVVFLGEAMQRLAGVKCVEEARERTLALETADGQLLPLLEDVRGRGFRNDPRLRSYDLELIVRRYRGSPFLQALRVYSVEKSGKFELDYWCDVCAIAMYELKPCECCQADTEFRRRLVRGE